MPDHLHFILWLDGTRDNAPTLGDVRRAYKSITKVTWFNYIKANNMSWPGHVWQRNYYDRVIRDKQELEQKRQYIRDNPKRLAERMLKTSNNLIPPSQCSSHNTHCIFSAATFLCACATNRVPLFALCPQTVKQKIDQLYVHNVCDTWVEDCVYAYREDRA